MTHEGWPTRLARWGLFWGTVGALILIFVLPSRVDLADGWAFIWGMSFAAALAGCSILTADIRYRVQGIGFLYWLVDDAARTWRFRLVVMEETSAPWRRGRGFAVRVRGTMLQFGVCKRSAAPWGGSLDVGVDDLDGWAPIDSKSLDHTKTAQEMYERSYGAESAE